MSPREVPAWTSSDGTDWRRQASPMIAIGRLRTSFPRLAALVEPRFDMLRKAFSFGVIGVINVGVDFMVFLVARSSLTSNEGVLRAFDTLSQWGAGLGSKTLILIVSNVIAWAVAVSGSYLMNTLITFAAESGGRLRWQHYGTFVASGILGVIANTATLVAAAHAMPVLAAKGCAILAGFVVNFSMSHFVVFRTRRAAPDSAQRLAATK